MSKDVQVSAFIDASTRDLLDRHVRATGVKKGHLIEEALRHYLLALLQVPLDVVVHPRIVLTRASGEAVRGALRSAKSTRALRELMRRSPKGTGSQGTGP